LLLYGVVVVHTAALYTLPSLKRGRYLKKKTEAKIQKLIPQHSPIKKLQEIARTIGAAIYFCSENIEPVN